MDTRWLALIAGALTVGAMVELLRRRHLKERYTVLWLVVGTGVCVLSVFPGVVDFLADVLGVESGPNLLFLIAVIALGLVCVHLSVEVSRLEDRTRTLAEEVGLLNLAVRRIEGGLGTGVERR